MTLLYVTQATGNYMCRCCGGSILTGSKHLRARSSESSNSIPVCASCIEGFSKLTNESITSATTMPQMVDVVDNTIVRTSIPTSRMKKIIRDICSAVFRVLGTDVENVESRLTTGNKTITVIATLKDIDNLVAV